jgi:neopullulanase
MSSDFLTPEWVHHAVFYQIFPDRFAINPTVRKPNSLEAWNTPPTPDGFKGGDLYGVADHLDYLQDLGVNAIYFTPIFQSASNHRYHTHDYMRVDPMLGGDAAFKHLLKEARRRNIKVILDGVFNHASRGFFQFNHILELGERSPYFDWFRVYGFPMHAYEGKPNYACWWNLAALPQFNHSNPQVRQFIYDVARFWIDQGIDGWRLDVPFCVDDDSFWQGFRNVVKTANPEAYITGEIPDNAARWLQGDQFDGVMNYLFTYLVWGFMGGPGFDKSRIGHWIHHANAYLPADAEGFAHQIQDLLNLYPLPATLSQLNLLDSHDTARSLTIWNSNKELLRLATLFQMSYPGAPSIYYGDEVGMEGSHDPDCRRAFLWDESNWDHDLRSYFKQLIQLRSQYRALRDGDFSTLYAQGQVCVFKRSWQSDTLLVILNRSKDTLHLDIQVDNALVSGTVFQNLIGPGQASVQNGVLTGLTLPPLTGALLAPLHKNM